MSEQSAARNLSEEQNDHELVGDTGSASAAVETGDEGMTADNQSATQMTVVDGGGSVKSARFAPLMQGAPSVSQGSMDLLLDVDLNLSVELGRTAIPVREILHLGPGSIVELDKLAGEPVDIVVNGKMIARGEVVVVDESFGVRVTEIASQSERLSKLM